MGSLTDQFGEAWTAFTEHPVVRLMVAGVAFYIVLLWLASALWAFNDARRRHRDPVVPYVAAAAVILASPVLFPLAIVVYRIVRRGETLSEARERALSDRLIDLEAAEAVRCPGCASVVEEDWLACPSCRARLQHQCVACGRAMGLDWSVCAWCGTEFGRPVLPEPLAEPLASLPARALTPDPLPEPIGEVAGA
jgi:hypothetical protein